MLLDALDDPEFARALARRLLVPTFPIKGAVACSIDPGEIKAGTFNCTGDHNFTGGKVGIGTSSPVSTLNVSRSDTVNFERVICAFTPNMANGNHGGAVFVGRTAANNDSGHISFVGNATAGQEYMALGIYGKNDILNILGSGNVGIGTSSPATSAKLEISSTTGALIVPRMTTIQRDALTAVNGMIIFNTTTLTFQGYNGTWNNL